MKVRAYRACVRVCRGRSKYWSAAPSARSLERCAPRLARGASSSAAPSARSLERYCSFVDHITFQTPKHRVRSHIGSSSFWKCMFRIQRYSATTWKPTMQLGRADRFCSRLRSRKIMQAWRNRRLPSRYRRALEGFQASRAHLANAAQEATQVKRGRGARHESQAPPAHQEFAVVWPSTMRRHRRGRRRRLTERITRCPSLSHHHRNLHQQRRA